MSDLTPGWIKVKGTLFLLIGFVSAGLLLWEHHSWRSAALLAVCVWSFCRFAGLWSFARYMLGRRRDET